MTGTREDVGGRPLDVITIGRASVDLYGQQIGTRLEDIGSFAKSVGGCPANISVGTARLGLKSALLTRVGAVVDRAEACPQLATGRRLRYGSVSSFSAL